MCLMQEMRDVNRESRKTTNINNTASIDTV
jgi:hypothetical protein